ncbi:MAG: type IV pilus twitching motility protein PilT [Verrucomicrobia bacterium]|nr:type IV pilus twitching motility protein PilT [Verrucomicrobiota bacterium]
MGYDLDQLLEAMIENGASDLHLHVGRPPSLRINGSIVSLDGPPLSAAHTEALAVKIVPRHLRDRLAKEGGCDFAFAFKKKGRLRCNVFRAGGETGLVLRLLPTSMFTLEQLRLPGVIKDQLRRARGLVLVTGPTGSGKTTTLASMIDWINQNEEGHIITLEDPIEYVHPHKKCTVTQREVGTDVLSFAEGVRAALRQDPDVILIGELRDLETIEAALTAAETGHLVLGTLHTSGAARTIERIVDAFPTGSRDQVQVQLASSLCMVISQSLLHTKDDSRIAAFEILVNTLGVAAKIRDKKTFQIASDIETGAVRGMRSLDADLLALHAQGVIPEAEVLNYCQDSEAVRARLRSSTAS